MRKAKYLVFEGTEGCGKSTYTQMLTDHLQARGYKVLQTREPGSHHSPLTMQLRGIMLDAKHDGELTTASRELVSQAIRSIHIERVVLPALREYDFIIQDRGLLSGLAYGHACGNSHWFLTQMMNQVCSPARVDPYELYDRVVYLKTDTAAGLARAKRAKQEFESGDAMEGRGNAFMLKVARNMDEMVNAFPHITVEVDTKGIDENFQEILKSLQLGDRLE
jgi:dTMP kinase